MNKYNELHTYLKELYPNLDVFINDKRLVIEKNKQECLTYYPDDVMFANLKEIPDAKSHIDDYLILRNQ